MIQFKTLSGILEARKQGDKVLLDLPLNPPDPVLPNKYNALVETATCNLPVQEVRLSRTTRKLLIRLKVRIEEIELML